MDYYVVEDPDDRTPVKTVEAASPVEASRAVEEESEDYDRLQARKPTQDEIFRYLVEQIGLSHGRLADQLDVSKDYIGHRMRGDRDVRRLDVLALERLRQILG